MTKRYEKFEEWMVGKAVTWDGNKGVVTRKHNDSDRHVWVEWENPDLDNAWIGGLLFGVFKCRCKGWVRTRKQTYSLAGWSSCVLHLAWQRGGIKNYRI